MHALGGLDFLESGDCELPIPRHRGFLGPVCFLGDLLDGIHSIAVQDPEAERSGFGR